MNADISETIEDNADISETIKDSVNAHKLQKIVSMIYLGNYQR